MMDRKVNWIKYCLRIRDVIAKNKRIIDPLLITDWKVSLDKIII